MGVVCKTTNKTEKCSNFCIRILNQTPCWATRRHCYLHYVILPWTIDNIITYLLVHCFPCCLVLWYKCKINATLSTNGAAHPKMMKSKKIKNNLKAEK